MDIGGALFTMSGFISTGATWEEDIYFMEAGVGMLLTGLSFQFQFRNAVEDTDTELTLSTAGGELSLEEDDGDDVTILRISVPAATISDMDGDYVADLVSKDSSDKLTHWAHGRVTFRSSPIVF